MKTHGTPEVRPKAEMPRDLPERFSRVILLVAISLVVTSPRALAQSDSVTVSAAQFQQMVYSAHLLTQLAEKPELDASLQVLLELHRRNPHADPVLLVGVLREATARYRTNAPAYIRARGARDEILAVYMEALRKVPARTNFVSADLALLNWFILQPNDYTNASPAELIHSGNQRLLASENDLLRRQALLDACMARAQTRPALAAAMDGLLVPETLFSLNDPPSAILGSTNSPLRDNATMQTLLALSTSSGNGGVTISSNQLMTLFTNETQVLWDAINTNLALHLEINQSHPDLLAYLTNQPAIDANVQRIATVTHGQARSIASATAAMLVQSKLMEAPAVDPTFHRMAQAARHIRSVAGILDTFGNAIKTGVEAGVPTLGIGAILAVPGMVAGAMDAVSLVAGLASGEEPPEAAIVREIGNIKLLIGDLSTNMNHRFDRVDQSLTTIFNTLNEQMEKIVIIGGRIDHIQGNVNDIRRSLLISEAGLHRLERHLQSYLKELDARALRSELNLYLGYEAKYGMPMSYEPGYVTGESKLFTHARNNAVDGLSVPYRDRNYLDSGLFWELTESTGHTVTNRLEQNLGYIKKFLADRLGRHTAGTLGPDTPNPIANPRDWFVGAYAYLQLAAENPMYFRRVAPGTGVDLIRVRGQDLTSFLRSLTFTVGTTNVNWPLHDAARNHYLEKLADFTGAVRATEQTFASERGFALDTWRRWIADVPCVAVTATEVLATPRVAFPQMPRALAASDTHFLVLQHDGAVLDYGVEPDYGFPLVPDGVTNVVAIAAAGWEPSLALLGDGTVISWSRYLQGDPPPGFVTNATGAMAIAASENHSLAVLTNGTVVGWGDNRYGQTHPPANLSDAIAVAAGGSHSLALKTNGTVVAWGNNDSGQTNVPANATDVVAIAAGMSHSLALKTNGTVVAWGYNGSGQTNIPANATNVVAIAAGGSHNLALRADGTVVAWGANDLGQTNIPPTVNKAVVAIAAGGNYSLALLADGAVFGWGMFFEGKTSPPPTPTNIVAIAAGSAHNLALLANGTVMGWGNDNYGQANGAVAGSNIVAIAAGSGHSLALQADGTVVGWGYNLWGQTNGAAAGNNVVAISAAWHNSLALREDGTVVGWGEMSAPVGVTNIVAISAGSHHHLALRADGRVFGWGSNDYGQATGSPTTTSPNYASGLVSLGGQPLENVVAIAAGHLFSLALKADGTVVGWGANFYGVTTIPAGLNNVVAIIAGTRHCLALHANGTVTGWGENDVGQTTIPASVTNVIAVACGLEHSLFLAAASGSTAGGSFVSRAQIPAQVQDWLRDVHTLVLTNLDLDYHNAAIELSGAKALLTAILELGLPYTLKRDDVLHGFLYGSESLVDLEVSRAFLQAEISRVEGQPRPGLHEVAVLRYLRFAQRLEARLDDLAATGQPEIPRLVSHTLRLLDLLRDAWTQPANSPPPILELWNVSGSPHLLLHGEPYTSYTLQYCDSLGIFDWTSITHDLRNQQIIIEQPVEGPTRFYRALLPQP